MKRCTAWYSRRGAACTCCAVLLVTGLWLTGCSSTNANVPPVQHPMLEGIPLPKGFSFVPERSVGRTSGKFRVVKHEYTGNMSPTSLVRWYQEYMPSAGFSLRQERFEGGAYDLRFDSTDEECNVRISRAKFKTVLTVDVGPLPKGSTERDIQPPPQQP